MVISTADETHYDIIAPLSLGGVEKWAAEHEASRDEALVRFVQFAVVASIADDEQLGDRLVLRGAAALRLFYHGQRATADVDFIAVPLQHFQPEDDDKRRWAKCVRAALSRGLPRFFRSFDSWRDPLSRLVKIHVSPNIMPCEARERIVTQVPRRAIRVSAIEEILAEKLAAILQQAQTPINRRQDVYDIAASIRRGGRIDPRRVAHYFELKCRVRNIAPSKAAFSSVAGRSSVGYELLQTQTGRHFIPFHDAWAILHHFVDSLPF